MQQHALEERGQGVLIVRAQHADHLVLDRMIARPVAGRAVAALATALIPTGHTLAVIRITGSAADLGIVLAAEMLPILLLSPMGGMVADRLPPRRVILVADLVRCAASSRSVRCCSSAVPPSR